MTRSEPVMNLPNQHPQVNIVPSQNFFEEILQEYELNKDPSTFKQLNFRPADIQQYLISLPSIFTYIQKSLINDPKDFTVLKAEVLKDCTLRLIESYNVSLSHQYDEYNPIIFYFPYLLQIGFYLLQWLLFAIHNPNLAEELFLNDDDEFLSLKEKVYQLILHIFSAYKYLSDFQSFGRLRSSQLFQALLLWLSLAVYDPKERLLGFVCDRLIDVAVEWEDIIKENFPRIIQTLDYLFLNVNPIPYGKVYSALCDLLAIVYEESKAVILERIDAILTIAEVNFEGARGILNKIGVEDTNRIEVAGKGIPFLEKYEYSPKHGWVLKDGNSKISVQRTLSPKRLPTASPAPPVVDTVNVSTPGPPPSPPKIAVETRQSSGSKHSVKSIPRSPAHQELAKYGSYLLKVGSFFPTIRKRWFYLSEDQYIRYYVDESMAVCKGELHAKNIRSVGPLSLDNWFEWKTDSHIHGGRFRLRCETPDIYYTWINYLRRCGVVINPSK
jgi:hypothetical protein